MHDWSQDLDSCHTLSAPRQTATLWPYFSILYRANQIWLHKEFLPPAGMFYMLANRCVYVCTGYHPCTCLCMYLLGKSIVSLILKQILSLVFVCSWMTSFWDDSASSRLLQREHLWRVGDIFHRNEAWLRPVNYHRQETAAKKLRPQFSKAWKCLDRDETMRCNVSSVKDVTQQYNCYTQTHEPQYHTALCQGSSYKIATSVCFVFVKHYESMKVLLKLYSNHEVFLNLRVFVE